MFEVPAVAFCVKASGLFSAPVLIVNVCVISAMFLAPIESIATLSTTANGEGDSKFSLRRTKLPVTRINSTSFLLLDSATTSSLASCAYAKKGEQNKAELTKAATAVLRVLNFVV